MTLTMIGAKATAILALIGCLAYTSTLVSSLASRYALASDLTEHIVDSKAYRVSDKRESLEDDIRAVEQEAEVLGATPDLTPAQRVRLKQLDNNKALLLRRLGRVNPR